MATITTTAAVMTGIRQRLLAAGIALVPCTETGPGTTRNAGTGSAMFLTACGPMFSKPIDSLFLT
jgi:hypothetical protein